MLDMVNSLRAGQPSLLQFPLNLRISQALRGQILRRVAFDFRRMILAPLYAIPELTQAIFQLILINGSRHGLNLEQFIGLQRSRLAGAILGHIEDDDMGVQVGRGVAFDRACGIVLEGGRDPLACRFRRMHTPLTRLYIFLNLIERHVDRRLVGLANPFVFPDEGRETHGLRSVEGQIPSGSMPEFLSGLGLDRVRC